MRYHYNNLFKKKSKFVAIAEYIYNVNYIYIDVGYIRVRYKGKSGLFVQKLFGFSQYR